MLPDHGQASGDTPPGPAQQSIALHTALHRAASQLKLAWAQRRPQAEPAASGRRTPAAGRRCGPPRGNASQRRGSSPQRWAAGGTAALRGPGRSGRGASQGTNKKGCQSTVENKCHTFRQRKAPSRRQLAHARWYLCAWHSCCLTSTKRLDQSCSAQLVRRRTVCGRLTDSLGALPSGATATPGGAAAARGAAAVRRAPDGSLRHRCPPPLAVPLLLQLSVWAAARAMAGEAGRAGQC